MAVPVSELQKAAPSAVIELFQLELNAAQHGANETYYFHAGDNADNVDDIIWNGQSYLAFPIEATEFEYTGTGSLPRPKLRVSNINGNITGLILSLPNGIEGAKVTRIRTLARYIDGVNFAQNNLLLWSEDITQAVYFAVQCTKTSATTITVNSTADPGLGQLAQSLGSIQTRTFSGGVKLKGIGASVGKYIRLFLYSQTINEVFSLIVGPLTSEYQLFTITRTFVTSTDTGVVFRVDPETNAGQSWSAGQAFDATEWQMNEGASLVTYQRTFNTQNPYGTPDPTAEFPREIYYIDRKATENRDLIEFELASAFDLIGVRAPKRQCISNVCQWAYRGDECGYAGNAYFNFNDDPVATLGQDVCGKRLNSCELRFSQQRFTGTVTVGSNIVTLGQSVSFSSGDPVSGFGLPSGTTVSSVSSNLVTVSQNATASSSRTTTGTIQSNLNQIIVASATGLGVGMTITGNYLQPNTQITAISGTTLTLSVAIDPTQFLTVAATFTGYSNPLHSIQGGGNATAAVYILFLAAPGIPYAVGQYISSSLVPLSSRTKISSIGSSPGWVILNLDKTFTYSKFPTTWTIYNVSAISSATYNFAATDSTYTFRSNSTLPYGSYPGIGAYTV